jgi:hypothetical protein
VWSVNWTTLRNPPLLIFQTRRSVTTRHFAASPFSLDDSLNDVYIDLLFVPSSAHYRHLGFFSRHVLWFPSYSSPLLLIRRESLVLRFTDSRPILLRLRRQKPLLSFFYISACSALFSSHYSTIRVFNSCGRERSIDLG